MGALTGVTFNFPVPSLRVIINRCGLIITRIASVWRLAFYGATTQVAQVVLDSLYKAMLNMRLRRKFVYCNDKVG